MGVPLEGDTWGGHGCLRPPGAAGWDGTSRRGAGWGLAAAGPLVGASWRRNPSPNVNATKNSNPGKSPHPPRPKQLNVFSYYIKIHFSKYSKSSYEIHGRLFSFPYKKACAQSRRQLKACLFSSKHESDSAEFCYFIKLAFLVVAGRSRVGDGGLCPESATGSAAPVPSRESGAGERRVLHARGRGGCAVGLGAGVKGPGWAVGGEEGGGSNATAMAWLGEPRLPAVPARRWEVVVFLLLSSPSFAGLCSKGRREEGGRASLLAQQLPGARARSYLLSREGASLGS